MPRSVTTLLFCACLAACGESTAPVPPDLTGNWKGNMPASGSVPADLEFNFGMSDLNNNINGAGFLVFFIDTSSMSVFGSHRHPNFAVTFSIPGFYSIGYAGIVMSDSLIRGVLSGSGFTGESLTVHRQ